MYGLLCVLLCRIVQINKDRRLLRKLQLDEQTELPQGVKLLLPAKVDTTWSTYLSYYHTPSSNLACPASDSKSPSSQQICPHTSDQGLRYVQVLSTYICRSASNLYVDRIAVSLVNYVQDWKVRCPCGLEGIGEDDGSEMVAAPLCPLLRAVCEILLSVSRNILDLEGSV